MLACLQRFVIYAWIFALLSIPFDLVVLPCLKLVKVSEPDQFYLPYVIYWAPTPEVQRQIEQISHCEEPVPTAARHASTKLHSGTASPSFIKPLVKGNS